MPYKILVVKRNRKGNHKKALVTPRSYSLVDKKNQGRSSHTCHIFQWVLRRCWTSGIVWGKLLSCREQVYESSKDRLVPGWVGSLFIRFQEVVTEWKKIKTRGIIRYLAKLLVVNGPGVVHNTCLQTKFCLTKETQREGIKAKEMEQEAGWILQANNNNAPNNKTKANKTNKLKRW